MKNIKQSSYFVLATAPLLLHACRVYQQGYSGKYEKTDSVNKAITANTNAVILEGLNYKLRGALVKMRPIEQ